MEILKANYKDIKEITNLYHDCSKDMIEKFDLNHWDNPYPTDLLKKRISEDIVYKVTTDNNLIATFMLEKEYPPPYKESMVIDSKPFSYLVRLAVNPKLQGKGLGSEIMSHIEYTVKKLGSDVLRLDILAHHKKLSIFYEKNGYEKIGSGKTRRFTIDFYEKFL